VKQKRMIFMRKVKPTSMPFAVGSESFFSTFWSSYLRNLLSLIGVGATRAKIYVMSSDSQWELAMTGNKTQVITIANSSLSHSAIQKN